MAGWLIRKIDVAETTAAGSKTYTVSSSPTGLVAKGAIVVLTGSTTADTVAATKRMSVGMYDGTTQRAVCDMGEDSVATANADTGNRFDTATVAQFTGSSGTALQAEAAATAFGIDSISMTWDAAINIVGQIWLFYGDSFACAVENLVSPALVNSITNSVALGATPDGIIAVSVGQAFVADGSASGGLISIGFSGRFPSITQGCSAICAENRKATNTSSGCNGRSNAIVSQLVSAAGVVTEPQYLEVTAYTSNGFTITTRGTGALDAMYFSFSTGGGARVWAGSPTLPASASGSFSRTDPGFRPMALFIAATRIGANATINSGAGAISFGGACANGSGMGAGNFRDALSISEAGSVASASDIVRVMVSSSADDWAATFTQFDATGWTGSVRDTAAADRPTAYMAIEQINTLFGNDTETIADAFAIGMSLTVGDTETISDGFVAVFTAANSVNAETETIADSPAFMLAFASGDTETITDGFVAVVTTQAFTSDDTETITDDFVFLVSTPVDFSDTETITDDFVALTASAGSDLFVDGDTETIDDDLRFSLTGTLFGNDTETIVDTSFAFLGTVFVSGDTETITDGAVLVTAAGFRGISRGTLMGAGAEAGFTYSAGAVRGDLDG